MTTDELDNRYKLLKQITTSDGRSFTAQECATGRAVLVHFLSPASSTSRSLATLIERLPPRERARILEVMTVDESTVVVTQFLEGFQGFDAWLHGRRAPLPARPSDPQPAAPAGEFTRLFDAGALPSDSASPAPDSPPAALSSDRAEEGRFTNLFRPPAESNTAPFPAPPPPAPPPGAQPAGHGSFTELFRPPRPSKTDPVPSPAGPAAPVELRSVRIPLGPPAQPRPAAPATPMVPPGAEPQHPLPLPRPVLPVPRLGPRPGEPIIRPPVRDAIAAPPPVHGGAGESDYTRLLRPAPSPTAAAPVSAGPARLAGSPAAPVAPAPPAAPPEPARSIVPLLLILNILVVIATGVILFFALKRR
jgi:hypothetical protein